MYGYGGGWLASYLMLCGTSEIPLEASIHCITTELFRQSSESVG